MVRRAWGEVSIKVEVAMVEDACKLVHLKTKWGDQRLFTEIGVGGGGAGVRRTGAGLGAPPPKNGGKGGTVDRG